MIPKMNDIELDDLEDEKAEENDQVLEQSSANAWIKVRMWIRQRSYAGSSMESVITNYYKMNKVLFPVYGI